MLKRILSMSMAILLSASLFGCSNAADAENQPSDTTDKPPVYDVKCVNEPGQPLPISMYASAKASSAESDYDMKYTDANHSFAATMLNAVGDGYTGVFSPLSLQIALQVLFNGGDEATAQKFIDAVCPGMTMEEINASSAKLIALLSESDGVNINSAVIASKYSGICESFADAAADYYRASVGALDFSDPQASLKQINSWISDNTNGLIDNLLDHLDKDTVLVILNALTLDLNWETPFTVATEPSAFNGANGSEQAIMLSSSGEYLYGNFDDGQMAIIPYMGDEYAMAVILPSEGVSPAAAASSLMNHISDCEASKVAVKMPKTELKTKLDILAMADKLNISDAINGNFSKILYPSDSVKVTQIVHGGSLSVTETGTTAAAATAITANKGFMIVENEVICDRPYAMLIFHAETGAILFASVVNDV